MLPNEILAFHRLLDSQDCVCCQTKDELAFEALL